VLSPLYKAFNKKGREDHEDAAAAVQTIIDDLRARFGFALIIEHHAPKGGQSGRDFIPFGSSLWLRWPEYGITLAKSGDKDGKEAKLGRFRGDRIRSDAWPSHLAWGQGWPWEASYRDGVNPWHAGTAF
jgi:replicative DNA helicase